MELRRTRWSAAVRCVASRLLQARAAAAGISPRIETSTEQSVMPVAVIAMHACDLGAAPMWSLGRLGCLTLGLIMKKATEMLWLQFAHQAGTKLVEVDECSSLGDDYRGLRDPYGTLATLSPVQGPS